MKKALVILKSSVIYLPACLIFALSINFTWQPTAYLVSFPQLFTLIPLSLLTLYLFHCQLLKMDEENALKRSLFWLWTGFAFPLFFLTSLLKKKYLFKDKPNSWSYFFSDCLVFFLYIFCVISLTLVNYKPVTHEMLFQYKKKHIVKGLMYYKENWGWVDKIHYRPDHFKEILHALEENKNQVSLNDGWITPLRFHVHYECTYEFEAAKTAMERWAQATAMSIHIMALNEQVQGDSPWYHGNQLSAWQFDDLSSGLLACLEQCPEESLRPMGTEIFDTDEVLKIWKKEGQNQISIKMDVDRSWELVKNPKLRPIIDKAEWEVKKLTIQH